MEVANHHTATLPEVLNRHDGDAPALRFAGRWHSRHALAQEAQTAAAVAWHEWGVRPGDRVAWLGANDPAQLALLFGLARIGAARSPPAASSSSGCAATPVARASSEAACVQAASCTRWSGVQSASSRCHSGSASRKLSGTSIAPMRARPSSKVTCATWLTPSQATRSPGRTPHWCHATDAAASARCWCR